MSLFNVVSVVAYDLNMCRFKYAYDKDFNMSFFFLNIDKVFEK